MNQAISDLVRGLTENRRIALEHAHTLNLHDVNRTIEAAKKYEAYLNGESNGSKA